MGESLLKPVNMYYICKYSKKIIESKKTSYIIEEENFLTKN